VVVSFMILWNFGELLIIDITIYGAGLFLEYHSLIRLRKRSAQDHRPFKIPMGINGLRVMLLLPIGVYFIALSGAFLSTGNAWVPALFAVMLLFTAELIWRMILWQKPSLKIQVK